MSRRIGGVLSAARRARTTACRRAPAALRPQFRSFSDAQTLHEAEQPPIPPRRTYSNAGQVTQDDHAGASMEDMAAHLDGLFPPLRFPPELAARVLTHASHPEAALRHNARMSFIGRRVLQTYLFLFLHDSPALQDVHDYNLICERALNTYVLGEHLAPHWGIGKVLKWTPVHTGALSRTLTQGEATPSVLARMSGDSLRSVGLYKIQGSAVEALVGAVFHQFGGAVAHRFFHTRVLPHILLPGSPEGLHDAFHQHALEVCKKFGGQNGPLTQHQ